MNTTNLMFWLLLPLKRALRPMTGGRHDRHTGVNSRDYSRRRYSPLLQPGKTAGARVPGNQKEEGENGINGTFGAGDYRFRRYFVPFEGFDGRILGVAALNHGFP